MTSPDRTRPELSVRGKLRKRLGRLKCTVLDEWPYAFLGRTARKLRERYRTELPPLPFVSRAAGPTCEIHMLCGHRDVDMGLWATWSLLRFVPSADIFIHSDGTLTEADHDGWRRVANRVEFTTPAERTERANESLKDFPAVHNWRTNHSCGAKFVDFHLYGSASNLVLLDSDVLCFRRPDELLRGLEQADSTLRWNEDVVTSYSATPAWLSEQFGFVVPERVNSGFMLTKRWNCDDYAFFNDALKTLREHGIAIFRRWTEQTLYAIAAARHVTATPFSPRYAVTLKRTPPDAVIRHYVGLPRVRPRFFTEGVPLLLKQLRNVGPMSVLADTASI